MADTFDVVIVGAGLGGLIAANLLLKERSGLKIQVIEAADRVCSSLKTVEMEGANGKESFDIGVTRVGSAQPLMLGILKEFGVETFPHFDKGTKHWQLADGKIKTYSGSIPPLPYTALADLLRYFRKMDKLAATVNADDKPSTENCAEWDNTTVHDYINKYLWTQGAKEMAATMVGTFCRTSPSDMSMLQYICEIKSCGNWEKHIGGEGTGRMDLTVKGGFQQLADRMYEAVGKERIILGDAVTSIELLGDQSRAVVVTKSGRKMEAKRVIVCIPSSDICKLELTPPLSVPRLLPVGDYSTHFIVTYKTSFWRAKKMAGELLSMAGTLGSFKDEKKFPLIAFFDHTSANGSPALMGLFSSLCYSKMTSEERKTIAIDFLASIFGDEARAVIDYADLVWSKRAKGEEPCKLTEGLKTSTVLDSLDKPHGCIHFAGEETGAVWAGMMESAAEASTRAVKEVLAAL